PNKVTSDDSNTLLHLAIQNGHWDVVQMLVDRGVDPGVMNREGKTPLMIAVQSTLAWQSRSTYTFQWLLDVLGPALVNRDKQGRTAVHWACTRPIDAPANWPDVSLYYTRSLVLKLYQCNNLQVLSWEDYLHRSASQLASLAHLAQVTSLLASACQTPIDPRLIQSLQSLLEIPESRIDNRYKPGKSSVLPPIPPIHQNKNTPQSGTDRPQSAVSGPQRIPSISAIGCNDASVQ
ncbi:transcriptional regulator swi6, partial [Linderina pennispora]